LRFCDKTDFFVLGCPVNHMKESMCNEGVWALRNQEKL
jgi:hypothetical protein